MSTVLVKSKRIVGIADRCSNEHPERIGALWARFFSEGVLERVAGSGIYSVYFDYEGDQTLPFTVLIGSEVAKDAPLPDGLGVGLGGGLSEVLIEAGSYASFDASGPRPESILNGWKQIWERSLPRLRRTDFEEYGPAELCAIYIGVQTTGTEAGE